MTKCIVEGCNRTVIARKLCSAHYQRWLRGSKNIYSPLRENHGLSDTNIYHVWKNMKDRCYNPLRHNYKHYGGRGIKVCDRWLSFTNFYEDMGLPPENYSLDRINNDDDYKPSNCRWVDYQTQMRNRRPYSKSGYKGIYWSDNKNGWNVRIKINKRGIHIGTFKNLEDAIKAREKAEEYYYAFNI